MRAKRPPAVTAEPPDWYRCFIEADWADDAADAGLDTVWVKHNRWCRWSEAQRQWAAEHPGFSPLEDLRRRRAARLRREAHDAGGT